MTQQNEQIYRILEAVSFAAGQFLKGASWEDSIPQVLEHLGQATDASRVHIFRHHAGDDDTPLISQRHEWVAPGITSMTGAEEFQAIPLHESGMRRWDDRLAQDEVIAGNVKDLPASERALLEPQDVKSVAVVPIFTGSTWWGSIGFDECRTERTWSAVEIDALRTAADTLGAAIQRQQTEQELLLHSTALESTANAVFITDRAGTITWINPAFTALTGYTAEEAIGQTPRLLKSDRHELAFYRDIWETVLAGQAWQGELINRRKDGNLYIAEQTITPVRASEGEITHFIAIEQDATERVRANEQIERLATRLKSIIRPARRMTATLNLDELAQQVVESLQEVTGQYNTNFFIKDGEDLVLAAGRGGYLSDGPPIGYRLPPGQGVIGKAAHIRQPVLVSDVNQDPDYFAWEQLPHTQSELAVPVMRGERLLGVVDMQSTEPNAFDPADLEAIGALADQLAVALENARLFEAEQRQREELDTLYSLSSQLVAADEPEAVLDVVSRQATNSVHVTFSRILSLQDDGSFKCRAAFPVRVLNHDLRVGDVEPARAWPFYQQALDRSEEVVLKREDPTLDAEVRAALMLDLAQSICLVPLRVGGESIGVLVLGEARNGQREPMDENKRRLAVAIADQSASALQRADLHQQTIRSLHRMQALHDIDMAITSSADLRVTLNILLDQVTSQLSVDAASVLLYDPHFQVLEYGAGRGFRTDAIQKSRVRLGGALAGRAALERRIVSVSDLPNSDAAPAMSSILRSEDVVTYYGVPLIAKGEIKGVLELFHRSPLDPDAGWLDFLRTLANQAAIAIDNAGLFERLQRSNVELTLAYDNTLEGWAKALEMRDGETEGHSRRVTNMAVNLAQAMGVSEDLIHVRRGALLHDIGKMSIPDEILLKPGPLNDEEWEIMKRHPGYAYQMLSSIDFLRPALSIPRCHHEKWDGSGYPRGLKGNEIPLAARIFAVVDVYDALRSDRPYREAWSEEKALQYIRAQAGKHFDPDVVDTFLRLLDEGLADR